MKITQTNTDAVNAKITLQIEKEDYQEKVKTKLKEYQKQTHVDGFRVGKAPMGLIKKKYEEAILVDELNNIINENLKNYIKEKDLHILGDPLPSLDNSKQLDMKDTEFSYSFDIGLSPDVKIDLSKNDSLDYFIVKVDKEMIAEHIDALCHRYADIRKVDTIDDKDFVKIDLEEQTDINPLTVLDKNISIEFISDAEEKEKLIGKKKGDTITIDMKKAYSNVTDLASLLMVNKEKINKISPYFQLSIKDISRYVPAEIDEKLFKKTFGKENMTLAEFESRIEEFLTKKWAANSFFKFSEDIKDYLLNKTALDLPEEFLGRWLKKINKDKKPQEIESELPQAFKDIKWMLISNKIKDEQKIEATQEELLEFAKIFIKSRYLRYGFNTFTEQDTENHAREMLENKEENLKLKNQLMDEKVFIHLKSCILLQEKKLSENEFAELVKPTKD